MRKTQLFTKLISHSCSPNVGLHFQLDLEGQINQLFIARSYNGRHAYVDTKASAVALTKKPDLLPDDFHKALRLISNRAKISEIKCDNLPESSSCFKISANFAHTGLDIRLFFLRHSDPISKNLTFIVLFYDQDEHTLASHIGRIQEALGRLTKANLFDPITKKITLTPHITPFIETETQTFSSSESDDEIELPHLRFNKHNNQFRERLDALALDSIFNVSTQSALFILTKLLEKMRKSLTEATQLDYDKACQDFCQALFNTRTPFYFHEHSIVFVPHRNKEVQIGGLNGQLIKAFLPIIREILSDNIKYAHFLLQSIDSFPDIIHSELIRLPIVDVMTALKTYQSILSKQQIKTILNALQTETISTDNIKDFIITPEHIDIKLAWLLEVATQASSDSDRSKELWAFFQETLKKQPLFFPQINHLLQLTQDNSNTPKPVIDWISNQKSTYEKAQPGFVTVTPDSAPVCSSKRRTTQKKRRKTQAKTQTAPSITTQAGILKELQSILSKTKQSLHIAPSQSAAIYILVDRYTTLYPDKLSELIEHPCCIMPTSSLDCSEPICFITLATFLNLYNVIDLLITLKPDIVHSKFGTASETLLTSAASNLSLDILYLFLTKGANPNPTTSRPASAFLSLLAVFHTGGRTLPSKAKQEAIIRHMIAHSPNTNELFNIWVGQPPLFFMVHKDYSPGLIKHALDLGANPQVTVKMPVRNAVATNYTGKGSHVYKLLIERGAPESDIPQQKVFLSLENPAESDVPMEGILDTYFRLDRTLPRIQIKSGALKTIDRDMKPVSDMEVALASRSISLQNKLSAINRAFTCVIHHSTFEGFKYIIRFLRKYPDIDLKTVFFQAKQSEGHTDCTATTLICYHIENTNYKHLHQSDMTPYIRHLIEIGININTPIIDSISKKALFTLPRLMRRENCRKLFQHIAPYIVLPDALEKDAPFLFGLMIYEKLSQESKQFFIRRLLMLPWFFSDYGWGLAFESNPNNTRPELDLFIQEALLFASEEHHRHTTALSRKGDDNIAPPRFQIQLNTSVKSSLSHSTDLAPSEIDNSSLLFYLFRLSYDSVTALLHYFIKTQPSSFFAAIDLLNKYIGLKNARGNKSLILINKLLASDTPSAYMALDAESQKYINIAIMGAGMLSVSIEDTRLGLEMSGHFIFDSHDIMFGFSPIHIYCMKGNLAMVKWLIENRGISPSLKSEAGNYTPVQIAGKFGHKNIVQYLLSALSNT